MLVAAAAARSEECEDRLNFSAARRSWECPESLFGTPEHWRFRAEEPWHGCRSARGSIIANINNFSISRALTSKFYFFNYGERSRMLHLQPTRTSRMDKSLETVRQYSNGFLEFI